MKKIYWVFLFLSVLLFGCADDQYTIERKFWYTQKEAGKIFSNLEASPPNEVERVVKKLAGMAKQYPNTPLSVEAEFTIARLYIAKKEFQKGRVQLDAVIKKYRKAAQVCAEALFLIGNSYEIDENWDLALEHYNRLMREYALTKRGLSIPIYIAVHYKLKYQPDKMMAAYQEAIRHYRSLAQSKPDTQLAYMSYMLVAECYASMKDWQQVIATLDTMIKKFKDKINIAELQINKAIIYRDEVKDGDKARQILESVGKEYPKTKAAQMAQALLKTIKK